MDFSQFKISGTQKLTQYLNKQKHMLIIFALIKIASFQLDMIIMVQKLVVLCKSNIF